MEPFFRTILRRELANRSAANPRYSLRAYARSLRLNAGTLSRILSGARPLPAAQATQVMNALGLLPSEKKRFAASLADDLGKRPMSRHNALPPENMAPSALPISDDVFRAIADWHHYAILELTFLPETRDNPRQIAARLGISHLEASLAIDRLEKLGLLQRRHGLLKKTKKTVWANSLGTSTTPALLKFHGQCLVLAQRALTEIQPDERMATTLVMPVDRKRLAQARAMIESFSLEVCRLLSSGKPDDVFQMTVHLHSLSQGGKVNVPKASQLRHDRN